MDGEQARSGWVTAAATTLIAFGAAEAGIGLVVLILGFLLGNPAAVPAWAAVAVEPGSVPALMLLGLAAMAYGLLQVASGVALLRGPVAWARMAGIGFGLLGAALSALAVMPRGDDPSGNVVFVPLVLVHLGVAVALATAPRYSGLTAR